MCALNLVKNMVSKLEELVVFDLDLTNLEGQREFDSLVKMNKGSVLVVMPLAYSDHGERGNDTDNQQVGSDVMPLTVREQEILALIAGGMTNKMIARELDICDGTVKVHVKNLMRKLNVRSRLEAAVWALAPGAEQDATRSL